MLVVILGFCWWANGLKEPPASAGGGFDPWSGKIPQVVGQLSPHTTITEPVLWNLGATTAEALEPALRNRRSPCKGVHTAQLEKARLQQGRPNAAKNKWIKNSYNFNINYFFTKKLSKVTLEFFFFNCLSSFLLFITLQLLLRQALNGRVPGAPKGRPDFPKSSAEATAIPLCLGQSEIKLCTSVWLMC